MILSIIVPVYNEEKTIIEILEKIKRNSSNIFKNGRNRDEGKKIRAHHFFLVLYTFF